MSKSAFYSPEVGHRRPWVELLEQRRLLATIPVTTVLDVVNASDGLTSLREAVAEANATPSHDTITFTGLTSGGPAAIVLRLGELRIREALTIDGPGAHLLTIDASGNDLTPSTNNGDGTRVFEIFDGNGTPDKAVSINGVTLTGGDAAASGGAIFSTELLAVNASTILNNSARSVGGGIHSTGHVTLAQSTVSGNSTPSRGGGVFVAGNVSLAHSTVSGNSALYGGGMYSQGAVTLTQSTISGNSSTFHGGGIYAVGGGTVTLTHSTVSGNNAGGFGGGILNLDGPISIAGSIVASNAAPVAPDVSPAFTLSVNYSLIGDTSDSGITAGTGTGNQLNVDPRLGPLANNGGPTPTHALLASSPAIDAGDPAAAAGSGGVPLYDQRGAPFSRVVNGDGAGGARIDMGAFEDDDSANVTITATQNGVEGGANGGFQVTLSQKVDSDVTVTFNRTGSANAGADYTGTLTSVVITKGQTSVSIPVNVVDDLFFEPPETVEMAIATVVSSEAVSIGGAKNATVNISSNDVLQVTDVAVSGSTWAATPYSLINGKLDHAKTANSTVPWSNLNRVHVSFNVDEASYLDAPTKDSISLAGVAATYSIDKTVGIAVNTATFTVLGGDGKAFPNGGIGADRLTLTVQGNVGDVDPITGLNGNAFLNGGVDSKYGFNVLPGDVTNDGVVDGFDRSLIFAFEGDVNASPTRTDLNGSGGTDGFDRSIAFAFEGSKLPAPPAVVAFEAAGLELVLIGDDDGEESGEDDVVDLAFAAIGA